ncbi:Pre-mRNA-splicing factor syf2 [Hypsizygus marmoreus]|uniref:Pre-mRNA-splicing factor SYF2 n=1 Tax=Hypsizygus marmoreus TaxID=39966 RepID=A0A369J512_HYPMA|nr:Pre-mRNA-splicing factor syf2 [Hypsizygus marmoreus]
MPPTRSSKRTKSKKAAEREAEKVREQEAEQKPKGLDVVRDVVEAAAEFVEEMEGIEGNGSASAGQSRSRSGESTPADQTVQEQEVKQKHKGIDVVIDVVKDVVKDVVEAAEEFVEEMDGIEENGNGGASQSRSGSGESTPGGRTGDSNETGAPRLTMEERKAKMEQLRKKIAASSKANRASLLEENAKSKITARDAARLEKQRKLAEVLRAKADAEENGEDVDRARNWEWTIEENDNWEKKLARKARRADFEFHDDAHAARRRYKKDLDFIKPDLVSYNKQKEVAMGLAPGTLVSFSAQSGSSELQIMPTSQQQQLAAANLYRDANTLIYGDNKPTEDAIDRMVGKINQDIDKKGKFSRKRLNEEEGDITYINEHNRVFNKKIARYYDKYTAEIRASFERGTAL